MMAGVAEPKSATGATGPGRIPREPAVLRRVAASLNAGFQSLHGEWGMMGDGVIYLPPKPYGATVATMRDGSTAFGSWPVDAGIPDNMRSYRQNMTVMVQDEKFNPYKRTWWGGTPADWEDKTHTTRTGICLTKEQFVGYFYGADLSPEALAQAMIQARCSYGIALDMNAGHSGLEFYKVAPAAELGELERPVKRDWEREGDVPGIEGWRFRARRLIRGMGLMYFPRYIKREGRDFFYLTLRHVLPGPPLGEAKWTVKGLPQHGFPYALALGEKKLEGGAAVRVLKVDPRMIALPTSADSTGDEGGDAAPDNLVAALNPMLGEGPLTAWFSPGAFAVAPEAPARAALPLARGRAAADGQAAGALCVQQEEGMLVYLEAAEGGATVPEAGLRKLSNSLGCGQLLALDGALELALGGDTSLAQKAVRIVPTDGHVRWLRGASAGGKRLFPKTPVVPFRDWYTLQSRRIRYFKKKKKPAGGS
jgi:hypothetical protein